ncbi:ATP10 protein-domain-containing protein [Mrakia frigida]|uniref:Atp10p n=1 Tax=Mrakia frigida TaxID=29902 RepID=UPI003FCC1A55
MPLPDSSQPTGPYLAPLASALGQKEVPKACEKKASFLSWEAKPSDGGERVSAGQRTLDTLTKAVKYLDPHTALPSQSQYLRQASSKVWIAPKRLLKEDRALYFPNLAGHSLRDDLSEPIIHTTDVLKGRISLVSCSGSILNTEQTGSFSTPAWVAFKHDPDFSLVQVNIQSTSLKSLLVPYFVNNIRASVPKEQHSTYIISPSSVHDSAEGVALGMKHALAGYVYLVDENLKIRWAGSGFSTEEERKSLLVATQVLLHRFKTNVENEALARDRYPAHKLSGGIKQWLENKPKTVSSISIVVRRRRGEERRETRR